MTISEFNLKSCTLSELLDHCRPLMGNFDIENDLLIKVSLLRTEDQRMWLFIAAHHLIVDGLSWGIFLEDLLEAYLAFSMGGEGNIAE